MFTRVRTQALMKVFGPTRALAGVDATFEAGRVTVIEGPNGSGKTTLLAMLAQLMRPTRGAIFYGDDEASTLHAAALRAQIGILAHAAMIYPDLDTQENLLLFAQLHAVDRARERVRGLMERFEVGRWGDRPARTYSRGQLQRLALARALVHQPKLLLLDEPSTGLDTVGLDRLVRAVDEERARGAIVVLITHDPALAERVGEHRIRLDRGRVVAGA